MKIIKILTPFIILCASIFFVTSFKPRAIKKNKFELSEREKKAAYEEMIIPTQKDTLEWEKIRGNYSLINLKNEPFYYNAIQFVRGLGDTAKLSDQNFDKLHIDYNLKVCLGLSPLVIKGKIIAVYPEDTINYRDKLKFMTNYVVKIEHIYKNKYKKLHVGDKILIKSDLGGLFKSKYYNTIIEGTISESTSYKAGESYFLCLDKYRYMMISYTRRDSIDLGGIKENYIPFAFGITLMSSDLSEDFRIKKINESDIYNYLNFLKNE
jgi:hypothetical protein